MKVNSTRLVVLDDDPTGIQTVHGCLAVTRWTPEVLQQCLTDTAAFFYLITNTRAMTPSEAATTIHNAVKAVQTAAGSLGISCTFLLRSDSTLRGHFPLELNTVVDELGLQPDARFFIPAFFEAGRYTENDTHWITTAEGPMSCGDSEYSQDSVFGYTTGHLPAYIAEKTGTAVEDVNRLDAAGDLKAIRGFNSDQWCIVNCRNYAELNRFTSAVSAAITAGKSFVFQTSSSFPKSFMKIQEKPLVSGTAARGPGLVIAGSHVPMTTRQLRYLLDNTADTVGIEISVAQLLEETERTEKQVMDCIEKTASSGKTPVIFTSRDELRLDGGQNRLAAGETISKTLCSIVRRLPYRPAFIISKGGITSHAVLRDGLEVDVARVVGPAAPGVPSLILPEEHRWPGVPYIIFPGNVGTDETLAEVYIRFNPDNK